MGMTTKSGLIVGMGETTDEAREVMRDLRSVDCDIMTIGQYLQPYEKRLPVERYVTPEEFAEWKRIGEAMGFKHVESSPLTRSSYHARQQTESGEGAAV
jgi:lipoic acid synthetase